MIKRFKNLFLQDLKIAFRNYFFYIIIFLATLLVLTINFLIPEAVKLTPGELVLDNLNGRVFEKYLLEQDVDPAQLYQSREAFDQALKDNSNSIGIIVDGDLENTKVQIIHQGTESIEMINLLAASIEASLNELRDGNLDEKYELRFLRSRSEPAPFNKNLIPIFIVTEAVLLGYLLIAVMVFQEKEEGSVRAYRVSPGGTLEYILAKAAINIILAVIYSFIILAFTVGWSYQVGSVLLIIILASFLMTLIGLTVSVFFKNLQQFLFVGVGVLAVIALPIASYLNPSFAPKFLTILPSYPVLFGLREAIFTTGKVGYIASLNLILAIQGLVFLFISYWAVKINLMREGR